MGLNPVSHPSIDPGDRHRPHGPEHSSWFDNQSRKLDLLTRRTTRLMGQITPYPYVPTHIFNKRHSQRTCNRIPRYVRSAEWSFQGNQGTSLMSHECCAPNRGVTLSTAPPTSSLPKRPHRCVDDHGTGAEADTTLLQVRFAGVQRQRRATVCTNKVRIAGS